MREQFQESSSLSVLEVLRDKALELGAFKAAILDVKDISTDASFLQLCQSNSCGNYGRNYTCPPDIGEIEDLMRKIRTFDKALVYQTVSSLEDSYDFEGMMEAGNRHNELAQKLWDCSDELLAADAACKKQVMHLGAGGCRLCPVCGKKTGVPCRNPKRAIASLEAHGINVSELAKQAGMNYINGQNTVTYFGAVFC